MRAVIVAATAAVHRSRWLSHRAAAALAALLVLLAMGVLQPAHGDRGASAGHAVVMHDVATGPTALAVRSVRQLPGHPAASPLLPAVVALPVTSALVLLLALCMPIWMRSRRARQAYLLSSAGPGPPSLS